MFTLVEEFVLSSTLFVHDCIPDNCHLFLHDRDIVVFLSLVYLSYSDSGRGSVGNLRQGQGSPFWGDSAWRLRASLTSTQEEYRSVRQHLRSTMSI